MSEVKQYAERDLMAMDIAGNHYCRHVDHMTREKLHSKSDIAAELGWRDMQIAALKAERDALAADRERFAVQCAAAKIAVQYAQSQGFECTLNTPAVDAYANQLRAEELSAAVTLINEKAADYGHGSLEWEVCQWVAITLNRKAANLRKENGHD